MFTHSQLNRFAIRKYAVGACSVLVASLTFLGAAHVSADELSSSANSATISLVQIGEATTDQSEPVAGLDIASAGSATNDSPQTTLEEVKKDGLVVTNQQDTKERSEYQTPVVTPSTQSLETDAAASVAEVATLKTSGTVANPKELSSAIDKTVETIDHKKELSKPTETVAPTVPVTEQQQTPDQQPKPAPARQTVQPSLTPSSRTAFRTSTRAAGALGDTYPAKWKNLDPDSNIDDWGMYVRNCTSFVAHRLSAVNKFELPRAYGNAEAWGNRARSEGYRVDESPVLGAVAWSAAAPDNWGYGHVAWVAAVNGDMVTVEEYNYGKRYAYNSRTVHKSSFTGYIHFKDVTSKTNTPSTPAPAAPQASHNLPAQGTYTFTQRSGVKSEPKQAAADLDFYEVGEKANYDKLVESDQKLWISYLNYKGSRSYVAIRDLAPVITTGTINVQNKNNQTGDFDVLITNVNHSQGIKEVKVPIWSDKNGQDDIIWYVAQAQGNNTYKVSVKNSQHKSDTGTYHIHLYYQQADGQLKGVGGTTTVVEKVAPAPSLPSSGTYRFTTTQPIKNQPSLASATIDHYYAGETVNYDRTLTAEGRQWLSYISRSGVRRYIPIN
ncbi:SH3 domain-containing protein [Streptococcus sp. E29BA]|uniref:SH3 domain-containing protein n=1 Tax=Streptococcus sp. E29BA TaxID=3278716 RepID=UPI00359DBC6D